MLIRSVVTLIFSLFLHEVYAQQMVEEIHYQTGKMVYKNSKQQ